MGRDELVKSRYVSQSARVQRRRVDDHVFCDHPEGASFSGPQGRFENVSPAALLHNSAYQGSFTPWLHT